ncbi:response regulator [Janthinobacterium sp. GB1R12]|uniref:response regulator n=1 Tax=Janthinobacterium sp. GB1R12 TaxID=3424190 RepID=UPI003F1F1F5E
MEARIIRVLLVDDHAIARNGVSLMLGTAQDICVGAQATNFDEATERIASEAFDVALVDIAMPGKNGMQLLQTLRFARPHMPVMILSHYSEDVYGLRALHLGASGYLTKDVSADELVQAVRKVASGGKYISAAMRERLAMLVAQGPLGAHESLSERELEVFQRIAAGQSLVQIGAALQLCPNTVTSYRARVLKKMKMACNAELIRYALELGVL